MRIYSIFYTDNKHGECNLVHRTSSNFDHVAALGSAGRIRLGVLTTEAEELTDCPLCGLDLEQHGTTTEIDTLESCIEFDAMGDIE